MMVNPANCWHTARIITVNVRLCSGQFWFSTRVHVLRQVGREEKTKPHTRLRPLKTSLYLGAWSSIVRSCSIVRSMIPSSSSKSYPSTLPNSCLSDFIAFSLSPRRAWNQGDSGMKAQKMIIKPIGAHRIGCFWLSCCIMTATTIPPILLLHKRSGQSRMTWYHWLDRGAEIGVGRDRTKTTHQTAWNVTIPPRIRLGQISIT
jgi:hypothetical protein